MPGQHQPAVPAQQRNGVMSQLDRARDEALVGKALHMLEQAYFMEIDETHRKQLIYGALEGHVQRVARGALQRRVFALLQP